MAAISNSIDSKSAALHVLLRQSIAFSLAVGGFLISMAIVIADVQSNITPSANDISVIIFTACFISVTRLINGHSTRKSASAIHWAFGTATALFIATWISMDPVSQQALMVWAVIIGCESAWWNRWRTTPGPACVESTFSTESPVEDQRMLITESWDETQSLTETEEAQPWEMDDTIQHWTRSRKANGIDQIEAWMYAEFEEGQQYQSVHIAFIPQFGELPQLISNQLDGPAATIKVCELRIYGARLECKLTSPATEQTQVMIHITVNGVMNEGAKAA